MKNLDTVRKEDQTYLGGPFWIHGDTVSDILSGRFEIIFYRKIIFNFDGKWVSDDHGDSISRSNGLHANAWQHLSPSFYSGKPLPFNYFPRGRVNISKGGEVTIGIHSDFNTPEIIDKIIETYGLTRIPKELITVEFFRIVNGDNHYDYILG